MLTPELLRSLQPLLLMSEMLDGAEPGSGDAMFGDALGIVVATAIRCDRERDTAPLLSLINHLLPWVREQPMSDGRKCGAVADEMVARLTGANN